MRETRLFTGINLPRHLVKSVAILKLSALMFLITPLQIFAEGHSENTEVKFAKITGKVTDDKGAPLIGVTVKVVGSNVATATDANGNYSIEATGNQKLEFSYVGFASQVVDPAGKTVIDLVMVASINSLSDVVVVGYGTQKKSSLTGAVSTISYDATLENRPITNASQAIGGQVPGIWVSQNSGKPGSDGAQLRVRGWGTLNDANPLVLIDGVEGSINEVNPNDIESISVLKDAASAAIYGSRAANGVVLVTLKSGKYNGKPQVRLSSYVGMQSLGKRFDIIDNSVDYMNLWNQALVNQGGGKLFPDSIITNYKNNKDPFKYPNTNFFDHLFKTKPISENNLSISGGSEKTKYFMSLNYLDQEGIMINTNAQRYGLTLNIESKVNNWMTVGGRLNGMRKISSGPSNQGRVNYIFQNGAYPFTAPYDKDGRFGAPEVIRNGNLIVGNRNPLIETVNGLNRSENNFYKMNAYVNLDFTSYLSLKSNFTSQQNNNINDIYNQRVYGYTSTGIEAKNLDYPTQLQASRNSVNGSYTNWYSTLNFSKKIGDKHDVSAVAGIQMENTVLKNTYARRTDPPIEGLTQVDAGTSGIQSNGNFNSLRKMSYFGRINYAYADKYLFEADFRADASSRFKDGHRWGNFPGVSAAWRLSQEKFIDDLNIFSDLKLRASWGQLGNENISGYWPYLTVVSQTNALSYNYGGALAPGAAVTALANDVISWETATTTDIGLDFGFLNNKLTGSIDVFRKITENIIVQLPIPQVLGGLSAPFENVGQMFNKGVEFNIAYSNRVGDRNKLGYNLGTNFTYIYNRVDKFRGGKSPDQLYLIREGYSFQELYGLKAIGIFQTNEEAKTYMHSNGFVPKAGDIKYEDVNNDGKIGFQDNKSLGNTVPKYTFGLNLNFAYKGFDLSVLFQGIAGVNAYTQSAWTKPLGISGGIITKRWVDSWTAQNSSNTLPSIKINDTWNSQASSFWVSDISFVKAKNIQLGYAFPEKIISTLRIQKLYAYINAQNILTLTNKNYEGFDPERNTFDAGDGLYPTPRIFSFGLNVNF